MVSLLASIKATALCGSVADYSPFLVLLSSKYAKQIRTVLCTC